MSEKREYLKQYYKENKEKYYKRMVCEECGGGYSRNNVTNHKRSKKHKDIIEKKMLMEEIRRLKESKQK